MPDLTRNDEYYASLVLGVALMFVAYGFGYRQGVEQLAEEAAINGVARFEVVNGKREIVFERRNAGQ